MLERQSKHRCINCTRVASMLNASVHIAMVSHEITQITTLCVSSRRCETLQGRRKLQCTTHQAQEQQHGSRKRASFERRHRHQRCMSTQLRSTRSLLVRKLQVRHARGYHPSHHFLLIFLPVHLNLAARNDRISLRHPHLQ